MTKHLYAVKHAKNFVKLHEPSEKWLDNLEKREAAEEKLAKIGPAKVFEKKVLTSNEFRDVRDCFKKMEKVKSSMPKPEPVKKKKKSSAPAKPKPLNYAEREHM